jgi:tetratricopeptide (TPR) repeat protein
VLVLVGHCERLAIRAGDCAYLLDRAAVYLREARDDPRQAIGLGERARALSEQAGRPDQVAYANILGNMAIALRHVGRHTEAVPLMEQCAAITATAVGDLHHEHIESILGLADALAGAGRRAEARRHYEDALDQARGAHIQTLGDAQRSMLTEVLNDYASELLETEPPQPGWREEAVRAATLLDEARLLLRPGDHGWHQTAINRAVAHHRLGHSGDAVDLLRATIDYCETAFGHYSYPTFGVVTALLDIYEDTGDPRFEELLAEAHDIDDHLAAPAQDRQAEPR